MCEGTNTLVLYPRLEESRYPTLLENGRDNAELRADLKDDKASV